MKKIEITMSATIRPSILDITLSSFAEKMLHDTSRYRLIINVDPIGENLPQDSMLEVARKYFSDIVYNFPKEPGFCKAVYWCWNQVKSNFVFHLEDDWKLLFPINIDDMIDILNNNRDLVSLRLSKNRLAPTTVSYKTGFIYTPKISLNPTLFTGEFIKLITPNIDLSLNPEKQLRPSEKTYLGQILSKISNAIYTRNHYRPVVIDIGRDWMKTTKYTKEIGFLEWKTKDENTYIKSESDSKI